MISEITLDYYTQNENQIKHKLFNMIQRCENPRNQAYEYYGDKGIKVCNEWKNDPEAFIYWCWENKYFVGCHIHRKDSNKDYDPENCILCSAEEHHKIHYCKKNKEFYGPFTMVGKVKDKSSRKDYADIFDVLSSVTNSATMKLFTFIIHHRDEETNIAHMPEWKDLSIEERKTNQKKIAKLVAGNLIIRIPVELKLPIRVEKFTYMINPFYYRPLKYEESKNLWNLIIHKGNQL